MKHAYNIIFGEKNAGNLGNSDKYGFTKRYYEVCEWSQGKWC